MHRLRNHGRRTRMHFSVGTQFVAGILKRSDPPDFAPGARVIAPFSLSNVLTVVLAILCFRAIRAQSFGGVVKLWRLALPPCLAAAVALVLLAGVFDATPAHDGEWLAAGVIGGLLGRARGWLMPVEADQMWRLVRVQRSLDGVVASFALLAWALIDSMGAAMEDPIVEPQHVAAGAALCAGYLAFRALAMIVRAGRAPHVQLHDA